MLFRSLGFRVECGNHVLVYATDNEPGSAEHDRNVRELAQGADVLIYDAQYTPLEYSNFKKGWGHSTWREGVNIAQAMKVRQLILFHHDPDHDDVFVDSIVDEARKVFHNVIASWEGLEIDLALGQHTKPQEQIERRLGSRQAIHVPLRVWGTRPDGTPFQEETVLENISVGGGYFLLENDPDPKEALHVELKVSPDALPGLTSQVIESRVVRSQDVEVANKTKRGIGVAFS